MPWRKELTRGTLRSLAVVMIVLGAWLGLGALWEPGKTRSAALTIPRGTFHRVFIIVLENADYDQAIRQPFLRHLTSIGAVFSDYHAVGHPSYPNYLAAVAGSTLGVVYNHPTDLDATSLVDLLEPAGVSWKVYAENLPSACFRGAVSPDGLYVRRHEPYISFRNVQENPTRCDRIVNAEQLQTDVAEGTLPQYSLYIPNLKHDGHDTGVRHADGWLETFLSPLLENPSFIRDTLIVVTFDETPGPWGSRVYTVFIGPMVRSGVTNANWHDHYSLLRIIEENYGVGSLGREDAGAKPICCVWRK